MASRNRKKITMCRERKDLLRRRNAALRRRRNRALCKRKNTMLRLKHIRRRKLIKIKEMAKENLLNKTLVLRQQNHKLSDEFDKLLRRLQRDKHRMSNKAKKKFIAFVKRTYLKFELANMKHCVIGSKELQNAVKLAMKRKKEMAKEIRHLSRRC